MSYVAPDLLTTKARSDANIHLRSLSSKPGSKQIQSIVRALDHRIKTILHKLRSGDPAKTRKLSYAEWLLDNGHILRATLQNIKKSLPPKYYRQLPTIKTASGMETRVQHVVAFASRESSLPVDMAKFEAYCMAYQASAALKIGELWALPPMLQIDLLYRICDSASEVSSLSETDPSNEKIEALTSSIGGCITSLRSISTFGWKEFVERTCPVDAILADDPAKAYKPMDFESRNYYRHSIENLSKASDIPEWEIANAAIKLADDAYSNNQDTYQHHVGYYLIDDGLDELKEHLEIRTTYWQRFCSFMNLHADRLYLAALVIGAVSICTILASWLATSDINLALNLFIVILAFIPSLSISSEIVNKILTHIRAPRRLPKLDFSMGIPTEHRSLIAVPSMLSSREAIDETLHTIELNYLTNADLDVQIAFLSDYVDAQNEQMPSDLEFLNYAKQRIDQLNQQYPHSVRKTFLLLNRRRRWNGDTKTWMGWERKRGKIVEFNELLRGSSQTDYMCGQDDLWRPEEVQHIITLDADTRLPVGAVGRLVGTLAHPLNQPKVDSKHHRLARGYSVIQPRLEVNPSTSTSSRFARVFSGDVTLDLYTHAVSDIYQDLFAKGIFAGKGIYHVDAFHSSHCDCIPQNRVLSHDLLEGLYGRAGLASDIVVLEDYPTNHLAYLKRMHRWIRGDWQLLPWLTGQIPTNSAWPFRPGLIGRWQLFDNLRRSLVTPSIVLLLSIGWLFLPVHPWLWTGLMISVPGLSVISRALSAFRVSAWRWGTLNSSLRNITDNISNELMRWTFMIAFLPTEAFITLDAVMRTLYRTLISQRNLLEWSTAADVARTSSGAGNRANYWFGLWPNIAWVIINAGALMVFQPASIATASCVLILWGIAPEIAAAISRPTPRESHELTANERLYLRKIACKTWHFFQQYVGPEHHWLPPDNVQFEPNAHVAQQTSPTNIGFALLSSVAAFDLGYTDARRTVYNLLNTIESVDRLEKYRGHLFNWYSLEDLRPLAPRYVSTVDSGNFVASLITVREFLSDILQADISPRKLIQGMQDELALIRDLIPTHALQGQSSSNEHIYATLHHIEASLESCISQPSNLHVIGKSCVESINTALLDAAIDESLHWTSKEVERIRSQVKDFDRLLRSAIAERRDIINWDTELDRLSNVKMANPQASMLKRIVNQLSATMTWDNFCSHITKADTDLLALKELRNIDCTADTSLHQLIDQLRSKLELARSHVYEFRGAIRTVLEKIDAQLENTNFKFLYNPNRHLFHVGYRVDLGELDVSYYDLLASEARLASFVAIAKGDAPPKHWLHLGRPLTSINGLRVLLSWSATSFEYLMPRMLMRTPRFGLISQSSRAAIRQQRRFARRFKIPWGISESGYYHFDQHGRYQYQAFGIPLLGLKWDQGERLVVSSYASMLALPYKPTEVIRNCQQFEALGGGGFFGLFEALDFGETDINHRRTPKVVESYMAHHQGMSLTAIVNVLENNCMVERFHRDRQIASTEYLLHEQLPRRIETQSIETFEAPLKQALPANTALEPWETNCHSRSLAVLANLHLSSRVSSLGGGNLLWRGNAITRWLPGRQGVDGGATLYIKDIDRNLHWSPTIDSHHAKVNIINRPDLVEFRDTRNDLLTRVQIAVAPFNDIEIRKTSITNESDEPRRVVVCSYCEPVLAPVESDARHLTFSKLFLRDEWLEDQHVLFFQRRNKEPSDLNLVLASKVLQPINVTSKIEFETNREVFLGRNGERRAPQALMQRNPHFSSSCGESLDAVSVMALHVEIPARATIQCAFLNAAGNDRIKVLRDLSKLDSIQQVDWTLNEARRHAEHEIERLRASSVDVKRAFELSAAALLPGPRAAICNSSLQETIEAQRLLWRHGISGDSPIFTVLLGESSKTSEIESLLRALAVCQQRDVSFDVVFIDESDTGYTHPSQDKLRRLLESILLRTASQLPVFTFVLPAYSLTTEDRQAIYGSSVLYLDLQYGTWLKQLREPDSTIPTIPAFLPQPSAVIERIPIPDIQRPEDLLFDNGIGGIDEENGRYCVYLDNGRNTPAPWSNILANPEFGTLITESGGSFSWFKNSGEFALTPWSNDPVLDRTGEALYIRDEETGVFWSPMPGPVRDAATYLVSHGHGHSTFTHNSEGLEQQTTVTVDPQDSVKYVHLSLTNRWPRERRLTITYAAEWILGLAAQSAHHQLVPLWDEESNSLYVRNHFAPRDSATTAFLTSSHAAHGLTTDGEEFLGARRSWQRPAGLQAIGLSRYVGSCSLPMGVYQIHICLGEGESTELHFALGASEDKATATQLCRKARSVRAPTEALIKQTEFWHRLLNTTRVETPDKALNTLLNGWIPYQVISSRLWGRLGYYQVSGGFGFRDQLQDVLALVHTKPEMVANQITAAASMQFEEGDVLHWWHRDPLRGVRTRCSDDLLWLPYVVAEYVLALGDSSILDVTAPFLIAEPLAEGEAERYGEYEQTDYSASIYEHCCRAIEYRLILGTHGLPPIGSGDWNDGYSRIGAAGKGESVWLAWFLIHLCEIFVPLCDARNDQQRASPFRRLIETLRKQTEQHAWTGEWYLRGFYDDGSTLGAPNDDECKIDLNAQTWAVLAAGNDRRRVKAMGSVRKHLVDTDNQLIKLLAPAFDQSDKDPGYIKAYPPGIRENGGQYNHAATWAVKAAAKSNDAELAYQWLSWLNPLVRCHDEQSTRHYRLEPYVLAGDIYGCPPFEGRGGWSWYSGSAAWFYRVALEDILGIKRQGNTLTIKPCVPASWDQFSVRLSHKNARYCFNFHDPSKLNDGRVLFIQNGVRLNESSLILKSEGTHEIDIYPNTARINPDGTEMQSERQEI